MRARPLTSRLIAAAPLLLALGPLSRADEIEAVSSRVSPDYARAKLPDGRYHPEPYAFAKGGFWSGNIDDKTIDKMGFMDVARIISRPLRDQGYVPAADPATTRLLVVLYWGTTIAPEHASDSASYKNLSQATETLNQQWPLSQQHDRFGNSKLPPPKDYAAWQEFDEVTTAVAAVQAENRIRENVDQRNAMMLGYDSWWGATSDAQNGSALEIRKQDMLNELEENRYFVVLMAYDFQLMWKQKKPKLLWETRFSVSEHHNEFDKQLEAMAAFASKYFGQDSHGLRHDLVPEGHVEVGAVKSLGEVPQK